MLVVFAGDIVVRLGQDEWLQPSIACCTYEVWLNGLRIDTEGPKMRFNVAVGGFVLVASNSEQGHFAILYCNMN